MSWGLLRGRSSGYVVPDRQESQKQQKLPKTTVILNAASSATHRWFEDLPSTGRF